MYCCVFDVFYALYRYLSKYPLKDALYRYVFTVYANPISIRTFCTFDMSLLVVSVYSKGDLLQYIFLVIGQKPVVLPLLIGTPSINTSNEI